MNENVRVYFCNTDYSEISFIKSPALEKRIPGVAKFSRMRLIPKDAEKPADGRLRNKKGSKLQEETIS